MVINAASKFDLETGNKLFSPKISMGGGAQQKIPTSSRSTMNVNSCKNSKETQNNGLNYFKKSQSNKQNVSSKTNKSSSPFIATNNPQLRVSNKNSKQKQHPGDQEISQEIPLPAPHFSLFNKHQD